MNCKFMEMQQAREERRAFWVTNWKQGNTRELSARVPSPTVNLYTVLGRLIPTEKWHSLPSPSPIPPCSSSHPYRRNSVCALTMRNLTELLTGAVPQLANNFKISDNEGNIKQGLQRKPEYKKKNPQAMTEGVMVRYITALSPQGTLIYFMDSFIHLL